MGCVAKILKAVSGAGGCKLINQRGRRAGQYSGCGARYHGLVATASALSSSGESLHNRLQCGVRSRRPGNPASPQCAFSQTGDLARHCYSDTARADADTARHVARALQTCHRCEVGWSQIRIDDARSKSAAADRTSEQVLCGVFTIVRVCPLDPYTDRTRADRLQTAVPPGRRHLNSSGPSANKETRPCVLTLGRSSCAVCPFESSLAGSWSMSVATGSLFCR